MVESISKKAPGRLPAGCMIGVALFLGLFCLVGVAVGTFLSFLPIYRAMQSRSWQATPCEVISSHLVGDGKWARPDIQYRYRVGETTYLSNRSNFVPGTSNDLSAHQALLTRYPAGQRFECYVDPADPTQAVINRELTFGYFVGLIFFAVFTVIPGGIMILLLRVARGMRTADTLSRVQVSGATPAAASQSPSEFGPIVLEPTASPLRKLVGAIIACLLWNAITGVFTYFEILGFMNGEGNWFMAVFLLLFQLAGLGLIVNVPYQMLALANPQPTITLSRRSVPVGGSLTVEWQLSGAAHRVKALRLTLEGREETRRRRGKHIYRATNIFHRTLFREITDSMGVARGATTVQVPADSMHTFIADHNKIMWAIRMTGDINLWPDIDESFDITVTAR